MKSILVKGTGTLELKDLLPWSVGAGCLLLAVEAGFLLMAVGVSMYNFKIMIFELWLLIVIICEA